MKQAPKRTVQLPPVVPSSHPHWRTTLGGILIAASVVIARSPNPDISDIAGYVEMFGALMLGMSATDYQWFRTHKNPS